MCPLALNVKVIRMSIIEDLEVPCFESEAAANDS